MTAHSPLPHSSSPWWAGYVGLPFGDGPGEVTCWGLVRRVYAERLGLLLPEYGDIPVSDLRRVSREMEAGAAGGDGWWHEPDVPAPFDVVIMRGPQGGARIVHVGVLVSPSLMLHVEAASHAVTVPVDHWSVSARIAGYRRPRHAPAGVSLKARTG